MNQLLHRLEKEYEESVDSTGRAILSARIAGVLVRMGEFDAARIRIRDLREAYGEGQHGHVIVWLMLAEGLMHYYADLDPLALDRVARAQILAASMRYTEFLGLVSAWKAHMEFETSRFVSMVESLRVAMAHMNDSDHDVQTRVAIVLANSFAICGQRAKAQHWFKRGHRHAVENGDQASIEALLYNRAAFNLAWLRVANCVDLISEADLRLCRMEVESVKNLQYLTQISALDRHIYLWEARLLVLEQRYDAAIEKLQAIRRSGPFASYNFSQDMIDLEIAFCASKSGQPIEALPSMEKLDALDVDDRMVAVWMASAVTRKNPTLGNADALKSRFIDLHLQYSSVRSELSAQLLEFSNPV